MLVPAVHHLDSSAPEGYSSSSSTPTYSPTRAGLALSCQLLGSDLLLVDFGWLPSGSFWERSRGWSEGWKTGSRAGSPRGLCGSAFALSQLFVAIQSLWAIERVIGTQRPVSPASALTAIVSLFRCSLPAREVQLGEAVGLETGLLFLQHSWREPELPARTGGRKESLVWREEGWAADFFLDLVWAEALEGPSPHLQVGAGASTAVASDRESASVDSPLYILSLGDHWNRTNWLSNLFLGSQNFCFHWNGYLSPFLEV